MGHGSIRMFSRAWDELLCLLRSWRELYNSCKKVPKLLLCEPKINKLMEGRGLYESSHTKCVRITRTNGHEVILGKKWERKMKFFYLRLRFRDNRKFEKEMRTLLKIIRTIYTKENSEWILDIFERVLRYSYVCTILKYIKIIYK